jgi:hypothetical protein
MFFIAKQQKISKGGECVFVLVKSNILLFHFYIFPSNINNGITHFIQKQRMFPHLKNQHLFFFGFW